MAVASSATVADRAGGVAVHMIAHNNRCTVLQTHSGRNKELHLGFVASLDCRPRLFPGASFRNPLDLSYSVRLRHRRLPRGFISWNGIPAAGPVRQTGVLLAPAKTRVARATRNARPSVALAAAVSPVARTRVGAARPGTSDTGRRTTASAGGTIPGRAGRASTPVRRAGSPVTRTAGAPRRRPRAPGTATTGHSLSRRRAERLRTRQSGETRLRLALAASPVMRSACARSVGHVRLADARSPVRRAGRRRRPGRANCGRACTVTIPRTSNRPSTR